MVWGIQSLPKRVVPNSCLYAISSSCFSTLKSPRKRMRTVQVESESSTESESSVEKRTEVVSEVLDHEVPYILKQRTEEWQVLRQERLTASTFASALGFYGNYRRSELWAQKLGLQKPFPGNTATDWGIRREAAAIQKYEEFTGMTLSYLAFKIYKEGDKQFEWIGGSPDALVDPKDPDARNGILEVKCPYNLGKPEFCVPPSDVPYHYIPQVQGLMEILDRDWLDLFIWTVNGSALFRVERDPDYWELIFDVLKDFWWGSVAPARKALAKQKDINVNVFKPVLRHKLTPTVIKESKRLAKRSLLINKFLS
ncbi:hypothetical protein KP509_02G067000 [Ceratopteris richardii]|uniref:YqaJ viral recombinase domain-containing protein n=1 Tax=Ceratopteris richardii TaxID=49495 RepID=A0A8T2VI62_CERRI|nr:hypothetical protein KP509_02G067000 [Ceratopteris richardii]